MVKDDLNLQAEIFGFIYNGITNIDIVNVVR